MIISMAPSLADPSAVKDAWKSLGLRAALIVVLTVVAYIPAMRGGFIWDDDMYITQNEMVKNRDGLYRFWFTTQAPDYYPATSTLWWLEWRLWGASPAGYHVVNVLLHAANAVLVWLILRRLKIPGAWVAGLVFALHPVNVATVAWISEQKNTLSMFFYASAILLFLRFDEEGKRWSYVLSLTAFLLALLSKAAVVMLPIIMMGCVWWLHGRIRRKDVLCLIPFFVLSLTLGTVTIWFQHYRALGGHPVRMESFLARLCAAGCIPWFYLWKALLPFSLSAVYPYWRINASVWFSYLPGMLLVGCFALFWWKRQTWGRPLVFAVGYFVVTLLPVLGFIDIGFHQHSLVADYWQYYSIVGAIALAVAGWELMCRRMREQSRYWGTVAGAAVLIVLGVATWNQASVYGDSEALWRDTVSKNPNAWVAQYNLANALSRTGRMQEAIGHYEWALQIRPDYEEARNNLAFALLQAGKVKDALGQLEKAVQIRPDSAEGRYNLANALVQAGMIHDAVEHYEMAVRLKPDFAEAHHALGVLLAREDKINDAIREFSQALQFRPNYPEAHKNLGVLLARQGKPDDAIPHLLTALRLNPNYAEAHYTVGILLASHGKRDEAVSHLQSALNLEPGSEKFRRALESLQRERLLPPRSSGLP